MISDVKSSGLVVEQAPAGGLLVRLTGNHRELNQTPSARTVREAFEQSPLSKSLAFDTTDLTGWDSRLVVFVRNCLDFCRERQIDFHDDGLPEGMRRLLRLARAAPQHETQKAADQTSFFGTVGEGALAAWAGTVAMFTFLGECLAALGNLLRGRASFRWSDALLIMQQCGPQAVAIVTLVNFLVGLILAFVGAIQLTKFGAAIYVADLVGIASVREMACMMTGIILCGRTGAAFAAQLGTMKVNEEISALETFGVPPIEFLVLPRMIALMLVMPFLCAFAAFICIAGGFVVAVSMLDISATEYLSRTASAVDLKSFLLGIGKGTFFGFLVAYSGCMRGMQSGHSAAAVGEATTRAVVTGITAIIASDGIFAVICHAVGL
jgi:phospholipid/cholesterol/gamma-HCH transport system permease protein